MDKELGRLQSIESQSWTQLKQLVMHTNMALLPSSMMFLLKFVKKLSNFPKY